MAERVDASHQPETAERVYTSDQPETAERVDASLLHETGERKDCHGFGDSETLMYLYCHLHLMNLKCSSGEANLRYH